jgi:hypothetical protein
VLSNDVYRQVLSLLRPLRTQLANTLARAVVQLVDDGRKQQMVQLGVLAGETVEDGEHFQAYGFTSVPLPGAEAVVLFPNGDRAHPLVVAVSDRRHRPTGGEPGEVTVYNDTGAKIRISKDGDIDVTPAPGREVFIRSEGGTAGPLVTLAEFLNHTHATAATGTPSVPIEFAPSVPAGFEGTTVLKAE